MFTRICVDILKDLCKREFFFLFFFSRGCREQLTSLIKLTMSAGISEVRWWGPEVAFAVVRFG